MIIILGVGILRGDRKLYQYALPLAAIGWFVALYHSLIQWHVVSDYIPACQIGVSCTTVQINLLGFITIPFMSLCAFSVIIIAMFIERGTTK